jgi:hypothetical protein
LIKITSHKTRFISAKRRRRKGRDDFEKKEKVKHYCEEIRIKEKIGTSLIKGGRFLLRKISSAVVQERM